MDIATAAKQASRMKGYFRAFEFLEEVLNEANAAQGNISVLTEQVEVLKKEVEPLKKKATGLKAEVKASEARLKGMDDEIRASLKEAEEAVAIRKSDAEAALDKYLSEVQSQMDAANKAHAGNLARINNETVEAEKKLGNARKTLQGMLTRLAS